MVEDEFPRDWAAALPEADWQTPLNAARADHEPAQRVFPPAGQVFEAFRLTPVDEVRVVILGQDPYPQEGQAHGLAFSVPDGVPKPRALAAIHRELAEDLNAPAPVSGDLTPWAEQGVLLLNAALTVPEGRAGRHLKHWRGFTADVMSHLIAKQDVHFALWGPKARPWATKIDPGRVIEAAHPSQRWSGEPRFRGSKPFSNLNQRVQVDWIGRPQV